MKENDTLSGFSYSNDLWDGIYEEEHRTQKCMKENNLYFLVNQEVLVLTLL